MQQPSSDIEIRPARESDISGIAAVRLSNGPTHADSGANPDYCRYLIAHEHLWVAAEDEGVLAFGGAVDTGRARLLSDLFVRSDCHGRGLGGRLLSAVMGGAEHRYTFASNDPAALPLYLRDGMATRWTLLEFAGLASMLLDAAGGLTATSVDPATAAEQERRLTGVDRSNAHGYWSSRRDARACSVTGPDGAVVGVATLVEIAGGGTLSSGVRVDHLAATDADALAVLAAVVGHVAQGASKPDALTVEAYVPGGRGLAVSLVRRGVTIVDTSTHMATSDGLVAEALHVVHPGLG